MEKASSELSELLTAEKGNLQGIIQNVNEISATLNESSDDFSNMMGNFSSISDSLAAADLSLLVTELQASAQGINSILGKIEQGEGSVGKLMNDDQLYANLTEMSQSLDFLLKDIRNNPKRYVHFSAFDLGKDVYISPRNNSPKKTNEDYTFKVHLISSPTRLAKDNTLFDDFDQVEEIEVSGVYSYMTGNTNDIAKIMKTHTQAKDIFPDASIIAFKNGRKVRLEKALRRLGN